MFYILFGVLSGLLGGLGVFTFGYAEGASYLSNNPQSCVNCHVMQEHYDSWLKSSHAHAATCNDCHLSHHSIGKWITKADNGFFHSLAFTLNDYHDPIQIKPRNRKVTQQACLHCHSAVVEGMPSIAAHAPGGADLMNCVHCHADVGHALNRPRATTTPEITRDP
ncbi:MAG: cytochrome c nitrite reductase small subunit [Bdellovibrionaceae bacterium]|nr:cytochrome c nitrite reductase small subunit [Pseudobdellovibrionaceae bacterium]